MSDFEVRGGEQFIRLSKALKAAGRTELRKELNAELRKAGKPLIARTREAARSTLPKRGGLADQVAREPQRIQVRTGERTAGVRVVVGKRRGGARAANRGVIRHPVFGQGSQARSQGTWVTQQISPGWFDKTLERDAPAIGRPAVEAAIQKIIRKIIEEGR